MSSSSRCASETRRSRLGPAIRDQVATGIGADVDPAPSMPARTRAPSSPARNARGAPARNARNVRGRRRGAAIARTRRRRQRTAALRGAPRPGLGVEFVSLCERNTSIAHLVPLSGIKSRPASAQTLIPLLNAGRTRAPSSPARLRPRPHSMPAVTDVRVTRRRGAPPSGRRTPPSHAARGGTARPPSSRAARTASRSARRRGRGGRRSGARSRPRRAGRTS